MSNTDYAATSTLQRATTVVLLFQASLLLAQMLADGPHTSALVAVLAATIAVAAANRRIFSTSQSHHAGFYVAAWRYGALVLMAALTLIIALRVYQPSALPESTPTLIAMLLAALIALKGAAVGKLRPNGFFGLRLRWTLQSRLAWEKAHRILGRVLFFGGLCVLTATPFVDVATSFAATGSVVVAGVLVALIESRHAWQNDPDREATTH